MRPSLWAVMRQGIALAITLALLVPTLSAQDSGTAFLEDDAADVEYLVGEQAGAPTTPVSGHERADILSLDIIESHDALDFAVTVTNVEEFPPGSGQWIDAASLDVRFWIGDLFYNVRTGTYQDGIPFSELRGGQPNTNEPDISSDLPVTQDDTTFTVTVPRELLRDHNGAPVQRGMQLRDLHVDSHVHSTGVFLFDLEGERMQPLGIRDRMPDTGTVAFDVLEGGPIASGPIALEVPVPFRASNGGEATIAYAAVVHNLDAATHVFNVEAIGAPSNWDVEHITSTEIPGGEARQVSIVVHTPSGHQHGGTEEFQLTITRDDDTGTYASATMGILYLAIPQPAGHHSAVYFHSQAPNTVTGAPTVIQALGGAVTQPWMDTLETNDEDQRVAVPGISDSAPGPTTGYSWYVCLSPHLQLGLDVNMNATGTIDIPLSAPRALSGTASAELIHLSPSEDRLSQCLPDEWSDRTQTVVASTDESDSVDINGGTTVTLDLVPQAAADFIPYQRGTDLLFHLRFNTGSTEANLAGPSLEPFGQAILPLNEYFDEHPAGIIHDDMHDDGHGHDDAEEHGHDDEGKDTPAPFMAPLVLLAAVLALRRR